LCINKSVGFTEPVCDFIRQCATQKIWQLGVCYGHQLLCQALVGPDAVRASPKGFEAGWKPVLFLTVQHYSLTVRGVRKVWQHHFDEVTTVPEGTTMFATGEHSHVQCWVSTEKCAMGTQFHPEFGAASGNDYFRNDAENLNRHGLKVDDLAAETPDLITGPEVFDFFFGQRSG